MRFSTARSRQFLDVGMDGEILNAPDQTTVSERWVNSHPAVRYSRDVLYVGHGDEQIEYEVIGRDVPGYLYLQRIS